LHYTDFCAFGAITPSKLINFGSLKTVLSAEEDICRKPPKAGECTNYVTRWYYNVQQQRCSQFYWGGCGGNENNFETEEFCSRQCKHETEPEVQHRTGNS